MYKYLTSLPLVIFMGAACSSATPQSLVDARAAYQRAAQGPAARLTPAQLHAAQTSLALAEETYSDEGSSDNARDRAYVAQRKAELAEIQASIASSDQTTQLAAQRIEKAKAQKQVATQSDLDQTKAALAGERGVVANQREELQGEKHRRQDAERKASEALAALAQFASVKQESRGTVITLSGGVIFASGKADLLPGAQTKLDQVAAALSQGQPDAKILVEGHTDSRGSAALNQDLSLRRADSVRNYLVAKGVASDRVTSQGLGPSRPIADNDTAEGRANNRRVEIVIQPS